MKVGLDIIFKSLIMHRYFWHSNADGKTVQFYLCMVSSDLRERGGRVMRESKSMISVIRKKKIVTAELWICWEMLSVNYLIFSDILSRRTFTVTPQDLWQTTTFLVWLCTILPCSLFIFLLLRWGDTMSVWNWAVNGSIIHPPVPCSTAECNNRRLHTW
jgi:hypothetical protein